MEFNHEIRKTYRYDAFGNILEETGGITNRLTYTGQMYDDVAGQYYLRARFYNPAIGRFLQEDTYRGDGLNLYAYCANNPVMYYDPSGYIGICPKSKTDQYKVDDPLEDPKLKKIYDKWLKDGIDKQEALKYLQQFGGRPDIEYLPYIDEYTRQAYAYVQGMSDEQLLSAKQLEALKTQPYLEMLTLEVKLIKGLNILLKMGEKFQ
nr:RHS repeat-associated core domain-containing protein [uncultured Acetatifactor sp.]